MGGTPTPKDRFTALDTLAVVRELRSLDRARADKAFDLVDGGWKVVVRSPGTGRRDLVLVPGRYAALLAEGPPHREELSPFARELRRLLQGALIREIAEPGGERILELRLSRGADSEELVVALEMFGTGNLIVARAGKILAVAHPRRWAHRSVRVGAEYLGPPTRVDPWRLGPVEIEAELARSRTNLASTLAARLALGGPVAEELIVRGHLDGAEPAASDPARVGRELHEGIAALLAEVGDHPKGYLYRREGVAVEATPYRSSRWEEVPGVESSVSVSFSEAAFEYFRSLSTPSPSPDEAAALEMQKELDRLLQQQRQAVDGLSEAVAALRAQAEAILAHFSEAEAELDRRREASSSTQQVDVVLGGLTVPLRVDRPLRESAQNLYEESKRLQAKLMGAQAALRETEQKLSAPVAAKRPSARPRAESAEPRRKRHWFEKYRWFISSEGAVVVAGRDAGGNDLLVRRHLKEGDVYVHADLHGAASVVVKHPEPGEPRVTETTYREAGQWAVAFSKAWRAGLASASAFWVTNDQVSKSAASGEFVARGAWVVHGTKNFLGDLPTELALGTIDYEGDTLWTVAPPSAVRARGAVRVLLSPGEERERDLVERELARDLGVSRSLLQGLLPAGGITFRRP